MPAFSPVVFAEMENWALCAELAAPFTAVTESHCAPSVVETDVSTLTAVAELVPTARDCATGCVPDANPEKYSPAGVGSGSGAAPAAATSNTPTMNCGEFCEPGAEMRISA